MTLTTHAITGATFATLVPNYPILGFILGFSSHFILDAIPHWDYSIVSMKRDEKNPLNNDILINQDFYRDLIKIGIDGVLGLLLSFVLLGIFYQRSLFIVFLGAVAGMLPDALQFVYFKWKHEPLISLQKFHTLYIHSKIRLSKKPILGISLQILLILIIVIFLK